MARVSIIFGLLLCGLSAAGMIGSLIKHPIQFVPLMFGIPILFCGVVGLNPHRRRIAMHTAAALGFLAAVLGTIRISILMASGAMERPAEPGKVSAGYLMTIAVALVVIGLTFALIHVVVAWQSRKRRKASLASPEPPPASEPPIFSLMGNGSDANHVDSGTGERVASGDNESSEAVGRVCDQVTASPDP